MPFVGKPHSCDLEIRMNAWAMSGARSDGDIWRCSCGKVYVHVCDEAEGCSWEPQTDRLTTPDIGLPWRNR